MVFWQGWHRLTFIKMSLYWQPKYYLSRPWWRRWYVWPWHCSTRSTHVKSERCTLGNAWVAAGRQITELSPNENYPQIIPHSELSSNYLRIARQEAMVLLVLCHEIFFNPLSDADCLACPWNENNWMLNIWLWHQSILRRAATALAEVNLVGPGWENLKK